MFLSSLRTRAGTAVAAAIAWVWERLKAQINVGLPLLPLVQTDIV